MNTQDKELQISAKKFMSKYPLTERMFSSMMSGNYLPDENSDTYNLFIKCMVEFHKESISDNRFTLDEVSTMFYDVIRGITEGTLRRWNPTDFAKYIRSLQKNK